MATQAKVKQRNKGSYPSKISNTKIKAQPSKTKTQTKNTIQKAQSKWGQGVKQPCLFTYHINHIKKGVVKRCNTVTSKR